jgi:Luciferase-like monooxygenase
VPEQVALAEEVGFSNFWSVEHHFQLGFSHCSAPEVLCGALSQRTSRIRIGHAVVLLPFPYNHPVRVAEHLTLAGHIADTAGSVFRPVTNNRTGELDRPLDPASVYQNIVRKYGLETGISARVN